MLVTVGSNHSEDQQCEHKDSCYTRWSFTVGLVDVSSERSTSVPEDSLVTPKKCLPLL